ncbi:MAG: KEOPS complex subunit Cgi121 [Promethearchaeota archaeon]
MKNKYDIINFKPLSVLIENNIKKQIRSYYIMIGHAEFSPQNLVKKYRSNKSLEEEEKEEEKEKERKENREEDSREKEAEDIFFGYLNDAAEKFNVNIQFLNGNNILSKEHIYYAANFALTSYLSNKMISKSLEMEILIYVSLQKQIKDALKLLKLDFNLDQTKKIKANFCIIGINKNNIIQAYEFIKEKINFLSVKEYNGSNNNNDSIENSQDAYEKIRYLIKLYKIPNPVIFNSLKILRVSINQEENQKIKNELDLAKIPIEFLKKAVLRSMIERMAFIKFT